MNIQTFKTKFVLASPRQDGWRRFLSHQPPLLSTSLPVRDTDWTRRASHSPGGQLLLVEPGQSFGGAVDHVALAHPRHGLVPVRPVDVGQAALQDLAHRHDEPGPAQAVVRGGQGLGLQGGGTGTGF